METNQENNILDAMKAQPVSASVTKNESVNAMAEDVLNTVTTIVLWVGIISAVIMFFAGVMVMADYEEALGIGLIVGSILVLVISLIQWAFSKTFINISRNLFNLNYKLENIQKKMN